MQKNLNLSRRALAVAAVVAVVGVFGLAHATLGLYQTAGTQYVGHWVWNDAAAGTSSVDVRIKAQPVCTREKVQQQQCVRNLKVEVTGVAADGSSEVKTALVQIPAGFIRQVTVNFDHEITQLTFIKILALGNSPACSPY